MKEAKPVKTRKKHRSDPKFIRVILLRIAPIALVIIICICTFTVFDKRIKNVNASKKYESIASRGQIDDPTAEYNSSEVDFMKLYSEGDPDGFDPLELSPLSPSGPLRPADTPDQNTLDSTLGYSNKQSTIWSIHDSVNPDVCAWIYMSGMGINYPIAQESETNYYLDHSYDKTVSTAGTLFLSKKQTINPLSRNLIVHGHNMRDGTMFATLNNYLAENATRSYYDAHRYIFLDTLYGTYRYQIFSVYKIGASDSLYRTISFTSNAAFTTWCGQLVKRSQYDYTGTFTGSDRILTLSTCDTNNKYRIIVHAKLIYPIPDPSDDIDAMYAAQQSAEAELPTPTTRGSKGIDVSIATPAPTATPAPANAAAGAMCRIMTADSKSVVRLRTGPGTTYAVLSSLCQGTQAVIEAMVDGWVKIRTVSGMEGYVLSEFLTADEGFTYTKPSTTVSAPTENLITPTPTPAQ